MHKIVHKKITDNTHITPTSYLESTHRVSKKHLINLFSFPYVMREFNRDHTTYSTSANVTNVNNYNFFSKVFSYFQINFSNFIFKKYQLTSSQFSH